MEQAEAKPGLFRRIDKTVAASVLLHVLVFGWGLFSFSSKALELPPEDSVAVDVISPDQLAKVMAGMKTGRKDNPKPLVEKVAEAKPPADDTVGKITEKPPVVTETAPPPTPEPPKVVEKKPEPKPEPPKPVAQTKPEPPKPVEKTVDPIAEALRKEEQKPPPKEIPKPQQAKAAPPPAPKPPPIQERHFDQSKIAALLDKRDPSRQAVTGDALNSNAALGLAKGAAADNSATWGAMFREQVNRCWKKPYGGVEATMAEADFSIRLKRDGSLETMPVAKRTPATPFLRVYQESALRAIIDCQPYRLPAAFFEEWKYFDPTFSERSS